MGNNLPSKHEMIDISASINLDNQHSVLLTILASELKRLKTAKLIGKNTVEITVSAELVPAVFDSVNDLFL